jgi:abortive infection bacteriophage resistance protein
MTQPSTPKIPYTKIPTAPSDLVSLLQQRGLTITNTIEAEKIIAQIGYSRLGGYTYLIEDKTPTGKRLHTFNSQFSMENVIELYILNRLISKQILTATLDVEVFMRATICDIMSMKTNDPHWHYDQQYFKPTSLILNSITRLSLYDEVIRKINFAIEKNKGVAFVKNYQNLYIDPNKLPFWHSKELISFETLVKLYKNLKPNYQKIIIDDFGANENFFGSALTFINYLRNISAHNGRHIVIGHTIKLSYIQEFSQILKKDSRSNAGRFDYILDLRSAIFVIHCFLDFMKTKGSLVYSQNFIDIVERILLCSDQNEKFDFLQFDSIWFDKVRAVDLKKKKPKTLL